MLTVCIVLFIKMIGKPQRRRLCHRVDYNCHRPNSEPNLSRATQFNERADTVAGLPASVMKGVDKRRRGNNCHMAAKTKVQCVRAIVKLEACLRNSKE